MSMFDGFAAWMRREGKHKTNARRRGHGFRPAGSKLARKAARGRVGARTVGVVSEALSRWRRIGGAREQPDDEYG